MDPQATPHPESFNVLGPLLQSLFFIFLFIGLIITATFLIRRFSQNKWNKANETSDIEVLERRTLSPKSAIYLIKIKGKHILIGESSSGLSPLGQFYTE